MDEPPIFLIVTAIKREMNRLEPRFLPHGV